MKKWIILLIVVLLIIILVARKDTREPRESTVETDSTNSTETILDDTYTIIAQGLDTPWEIVMLPTREFLITERKGVLRVITQTGSIEIPVDGVVERGEGGLLGLALHPNFVRNNYIYLYYTTVQGRTINRVVRYTFQDNTLTQPVIILDNLPGSGNHNGGRIAFGPDGYLYVTTGDAGSEDSAQDTSSLAGKVLRVTDDGSIPEDNPFGNAVYSYGHRNPQGLSWDDKGNLWATEHGRSGIQSGYDEINLIVKGGNYGWPIIQGDEVRDGMIAPIIHSGPTTTWAPAGLAYADGKLYFAGLRGQALYEVSLTDDGNLKSLQEHFKNELGRLRAVVGNSNESLYISTSNKDGRGSVRDGDDKFIQITISNQ